MNPSSNETPGISLPAPAEQGPADALATTGQRAERKPNKAAERSRPSAPEAASRAAAQAAPVIPTVPIPPTDNVTVQSDDSSTTQTGLASKLRDEDLIEKEWVNKAKQIVERTRDDPYQQSNELTLVKADYMKKRYNKTIKVDE